MTVDVHADKVQRGWSEYIKTKFDYPDLFELKTDKNKCLTIIESVTSKTKIYFNWKDESKKILIDCQFSNEDAKGWSGDTCQEFENGLVFNSENARFIDNILDTPMFTGWVSLEYYLGKINYKTESFADKSKLEILCVESRWYAIVFYPVIFFLSLIPGISHKRETFVSPIVLERRDGKQL